MPDITDGMNELEFLASKSAAGKLIIVTGTATGTGSIASYTPASGATFVLYRASIRLKPGGSVAFTAQLRNDGTVRETIYGDSVVVTPSGVEFIIRGDQLVGTGSKVYDINISAVTSTPNMVGTIIGYLL